MAYCSNCGKFVADGTRFCGNCGYPANDREDRTQRQQEFAGKIIKCPVCETEIPSFTAICPSCGHEINSAQVSSALKDFINQISQCDAAIAKRPAEQKKGWKSWSKGKKFGWVILNIYTMCIPLIIYLLLPLLGISGVSSFSPEEKKKANLINNYAFPNDRESILEGLLYIKGQVSALASDKIDYKSLRWTRIWKNKASQLFEKAELMFKGDKIAIDSYTSILDNEKTIKKSFFMRLIVGAVLVALFVMFMFSRRAGRSTKEIDATIEWPTSGIALQLPEPPTIKGEIDYNDDEEFEADMLNVSKEQYSAYVEACREKGFIIDEDKGGSTYTAFNKDGYKLELTHYSSNAEMSIKIEAPESMAEIRWPKSNIAKRLPLPKSSFGRINWEADSGFVIYLGHTSKDDFLDYADACYAAGFNVDYHRGDTYFRADDKEGYHVNIKYEGNNVMFIRIDAPK